MEGVTSINGTAGLYAPVSFSSGPGAAARQTEVSNQAQQNQAQQTTQLNEQQQAQGNTTATRGQNVNILV